MKPHVGHRKEKGREREGKRKKERREGGEKGGRKEKKLKIE